MSGPYDGILRHTRRFSAKHPPMPNAERAAQFAPFAALSGYEEAVEEAARLTDIPAELTDDRIAVLDSRLRLLVRQLADKPEITVTYFQPDSRKAGGACRTVTGRVTRIDADERTVYLTDGTRIGIDRIRDIQGALFEAWDLE